MKTLLILILGRSPQDDVQWLHCAVDGSKLLSKGHCNTDELQELTLRHASSPCALIVPGEDVRTLKVKLPNHSKAAINTLPFLVEEHISTKLESVHIATLQVEKTKVTTLITEIENMERWLALVPRTQLKWLTPDYLLLPEESQLIKLWDNQETYLVNTLEFKGVIPKFSIEHFKKAFWDERNFESVELANASITETPSRFTQQMLANITQLNVVNLLQGNFKSYSTDALVGQHFRLPILLGSTLIFSWVLTLWLQNTSLKDKVDAVQTQMLTIYQQVDPDAQRIINPLSQLKIKLNQNKVIKQDLLTWLQIVSSQLKQKNIQINSLKYDNSPQKLYLQIEGSSFNILENAAQQLNAQAKGAFNVSLGALQKSSSSNMFTTTITLIGP